MRAAKKTELSRKEYDRRPEIMRKRILVCAAAAVIACAPFGTEAAFAATNEETVFAYLTDTIGFNEAAACGVMANIEAEFDFDPNATGDNGKSYGICQWYNTRFTALKTWCSSNGYNYTMLSAQLNYLKFELSANDSAYLYNGKTIYNYMTNEDNVPNTADGAYEAGRYWCVKYEVPANYTAVSKVRGARARDYFWEEYVVNGGANLTDTSSDADSSSVTDTSIKITNVTKPGKVVYGTLFTLTGDLTSELAITNVTVTVYDANGKVKTTASSTPDKTRCSIEGYLDNHVYISKLKPGKYRYEVKATNSAGIYTLVNSSFTVRPKSTTVKSVSGGKKKVTVKWKKRTACSTGYEIKYAANKSMKNAKTKTVKGKNKASATIKNLKSGKTYYVRVRAYSTYTVNGVKQKVYSTWSAKKKVRVY